MFSQKIVSDKLKEQFGYSDTLGVVFKPESQISQLLSKSDEIKNFTKKYIGKYLKGKTVNGSKYFGSNSDLATSLGHADIIYSHINKNGNIELIILDTYDFNKNDPDWRVQIARVTEEAGIIREYYTLILVEITLYQWLLWLFELKYI